MRRPKSNPPGAPPDTPDDDHALQRARQFAAQRGLPDPACKTPAPAKKAAAKRTPAKKAAAKRTKP